MTEQNLHERYPSYRIVLHWLIVALVLFMLVTGFAAAGTTNADGKLALLQIHATAGVATAALATIWLIGRLVGGRVGSLEGTWIVSRVAARATHFLLLAILIATAAGGAATLYVSGAIDIVLGDAPPPFPDFFAYPVRRLHGLGARLVILFVSIHAIAGAYHHFIRRRPTFRRISF